MVELARLRDAELVTKTVMTSLGLRDESSRWPVSRLIEYVASKRLLLVLDNCEHLLDACALLADAVLREAPSLRILATSRQPLGVAGETVVQVGPLSVPDVDGRTGRRTGSPSRRPSPCSSSAHGRPAQLRGDRRQPGRRGRAGASAGRHPPGDRARGRATSHPWPGSAGRAAQRPFPSARRRRQDGTACANRRSKPPSPGATIYWGPMIERSCVACPCSPARSAWRRPRGWARLVHFARRRVWTS